MRRALRRGIGIGAALLAGTAATVALGVVVSGPRPQDPPARADDKDKDTDKDKAAPDATAPAGKEKDATARKSRRGGLRVPVGAAPKDRRAAVDPLRPDRARVRGAAGAQAGGQGQQAPGQAQAQPQPAPAGAGAAAPNAERTPTWPFHYTLRFEGGDGRPLDAAYYPAQQPFEAPALILLHGIGPGRSAKDFEEPIDELKGVGFARFMQEQGYAVLSLDLRRFERREPTAQDWQTLVADVQSAYLFLVDRHNRGELNVGKLGVVGLGSGANLALAWAASPVGGLSAPGRLSDIGALVLVSPVAEVPGMPLARVLPQVAPRFPILALCGDRDETSIRAVRDNQRIIERHRLSRVAYQDTTLRAERLLSFFPKVPNQIATFLDDPVKQRNLDWEPRYLLDPIAYDNVVLVPDSGFAGPAQAQAGGAAAAPANAPANPAAKAANPPARRPEAPKAPADGKADAKR
jgi:acetyl esterase/lipase